MRAYVRESRSRWAHFGHIQGAPPLRCSLPIFAPHCGHSRVGIDSHIYSPQLIVRRSGALDECCHTTLALPASLHSPLGSKRLGVSRFLEEGRPYLLPRDDVGGVLLVVRDAMIKLGSLCISERCGIRFKAFPDSIEQFCLLERLSIWSCRSLICLST